MKINATNNQYRLFFTRLMIFIMTVGIIDFAFGKLLMKAYFSQRVGEDALTTHAIQNVKSSVLVFGSSRAVNNFDPEIITGETGLSCFNAGRIGQSVFYHSAVLQAALHRYTPEVVVLTLDANDFAADPQDYDRIASLLPYYSSCEQVRATVHLRSPLERLKLLSGIYPYNSLILPIAKGTLANKQAGINENGYLQLHKVFPGPVQMVDYRITGTKLDPEKINAYRSFLALCQQKGIKLYVICPPYMIHPVGKSKTLLMAEDIALKMKVPYLDYSNDPGFTGRKQIFADFRHLNAEGSQEFSRFIAARISKEDAGDVSCK